ncbi:MAG: sigma 54-interacting transcriptional regulator [Desulfamplus sp.]|nr:sigma 54-interacting transcriptional regulator [Desulfamplus sp.]
MKKQPLTTDERRFFRTVYHASFANPFGELREKLDKKIAGLVGLTSNRDNLTLNKDNLFSRREISDRCIQEVDLRIKQLANQGRGSINAFTGQDREIMRVVFLFDIFHKFREQFDKLIVDQIKAGDAPIPVLFAKDATAMLYQRGLPENCFNHYIAFSFQLRRAFFFISNSLVGISPCMRELKGNLWNNVFTNNIGLYDKILWNRMEDFSTLILGETGTGKGTAAMAIGRSGFIPFNEKKGCFEESFTKAFIPINLSQFPESLLESELFGHKKGAFTGAVDDYHGVFDHCSQHGAIFLDEVGEVSSHVQIKLLRVLQDRVFTPVGSHLTSRFRGRVIAATNRSMAEIIDGKIFRDDFYYRLSSDIFEVPPLRKRIKEEPAELELLLSFTVEKILGEPFPELVKRITTIINRQLGRDYHWPGNVRELEQCVKRVILRRHYQGHPKAEIFESPPKIGLTKTNQVLEIKRSEKPQLKISEPIEQISETIKLDESLISRIKNGEIDASTLISDYCKYLYKKYGTYEAVAKKTGLDRRTVKKHITTQ